MRRSLYRCALLTFAALLAAVHGLAAQEIVGRLVQSGSSQPIEAGAVSLIRAADSVTIAEARTTPDGRFHMERVRDGTYTLRFRSLGFTPAERNDVVVDAAHRLIDLGNIELSEVASRIAGQVVTAEHADVTLTPDRNTYSTKNMTTASGGTAVDVLRNVPSVEVDASNNVTLRGNASVVVQINGRPTPLKGEQLGNFLAQLPASAVRNVEVSTNPSAKNDPDGTAGIINIVLDRDADLGWSGGFTVATGTTGQANASANVGHQSGPLTLFGSYGVFRTHQDLGGHSLLTNFGASDPAVVRSRIVGSIQPLWQNAMLRTEYKLDARDAVSFDGTLTGGDYTRDNVSYFTDIDQMGAVLEMLSQTNNQSVQYVTRDFTVGFHRTGESSARAFSSQLRFEETAGTVATNLFGDALQHEHDLSRIVWPQWTLQGDYTEPFGGGAGSSATKVETGFKEILRANVNDFAARYLDSASHAFIADPARANAFDYHEQIAAGYVLLTRRASKLEAQGGLRLEAESNTFNQYASAFPSGVLSYDLTSARKVKLSYSRRINRPDPSQLDPVEFREGARDVYHGNAQLRPEYTDALELGLQDTHGWGTVQVNPYLRSTAHAMRFIESVDSTGTTIETYDNVASTRQLGTDVNVTYKAGALNLLTGGNVERYRSNAANLPGDPSARALLWSARVNATWTVSHELDAQLTTNYRSAFATEGGSRQAFVFMNLAVRHKLWNDQGSITVRAQDPFNLLKVGSVTTNGTGVQSSVLTYGIRGVFIAVTRNFGQEVKLKPADTPQAAAPAGPPGM
ncbi:MAG TPA: TonB-dependent receptor [Gemmatimonadaceae bacterium]|jgi:outer membrane receptor protein involved in Fe transport|nr:TonB-dependent receptor [Gemmatimonadaceae bacterium]